MAIKKYPYQKKIQERAAKRRRILTNDQCLGTHLLCNKFCPLSLGQIWDYILFYIYILYRFYSFSVLLLLLLLFRLSLFPDFSSIQWWIFHFHISFYDKCFFFLPRTQNPLTAMEEFLLHYNNWPSTFSH